MINKINKKIIQSLVDNLKNKEIEVDNVILSDDKYINELIKELCDIISKLHSEGLSLDSIENITSGTCEALKNKEKVLCKK